jgi:hypothetical protein
VATSRAILTWRVVLRFLSRVGAYLRQAGGAFTGRNEWSDAARWDHAYAAGYRDGVLDERNRRTVADVSDP